ncbi:hypothetical protein L4D00_17760 [Photobacterium swingsii]|uniref:Uncharacterized protein n=1 Tax=Photobacterium swingsii TaxID=680026 RepID=A0A2T3P330_9GAMM|nr:hypothetical protein [Photobacterium swingsii]PSW22929.1 hypothetical protein C9I94_17240 [Photobacterium swingsii]
MPFHRPIFFLLLLSTSSSAFAASPVKALPENELICMKALEKLIVSKQMVFSDSSAEPDARRDAERVIDAAREVFNNNQSYCEAESAMHQYRSDKEAGFRSRQGEINFFGRGVS